MQLKGTSNALSQRLYTDTKTLDTGAPPSCAWERGLRKICDRPDDQLAPTISRRPPPWPPGHNQWRSQASTSRCCAAWSKFSASLELPRFSCTCSAGRRSLVCYPRHHQQSKPSLRQPAELSPSLERTDTLDQRAWSSSCCVVIMCAHACVESPIAPATTFSSKLQLLSAPKIL